MRIRPAAIGLSLLLASNAWADLRSFDVDFRYRQEVFDALDELLVSNPQFSSPGTVSGRVELLPSGQILVNAAPSTLDQVEQLIDAIRKSSVEAAPRVTLRYWAVLGSRATGNAPNNIGVAPPPVLNDVLTELKRLNGDVTFRLLGTAAVTSDSGQHGQIDAPTISVEQIANVQRDMLNAYMRMQLEVDNPKPGDSRVTVGEVELRTTLKRGEFVVLGESQAQIGTLDGPVFYIVHWAGE